MSIAINGASNEFYARRDAAGSSSRTYHANGAARAIPSASFFMAFLSEANRGGFRAGCPPWSLPTGKSPVPATPQVVHTTLPFPEWGQQSVFISNCRRIRAAHRIFLSFQLIIGYAKLNDGFLAASGSRRTARGGCLDFPGCDRISTPASRSSHDGVAATCSSCPSLLSTSTAPRVYASFADARRVYTPFRRGDS